MKDRKKSPKIEGKVCGQSLKCEYFPLCSGCERQGNVSEPPSWQELKGFFQLMAPGLQVPLTAKEITGWRVRSKLAVRGTAKAPQIGLFKAGSHDVVAIPNCPLHHPSINAISAKVCNALIEGQIEPYHEESATGLLRYLQFVVERKTKKVQLSLVVNRSGKDPVLDRFVQRLYREGGLQSIWLNFQPAQTNRIFGEQWVLCEGEAYLWEHLGGVDCAFHPACFGQAHLSIYEEVLKRIRLWGRPGARVLELYAGIGVIGLNLAAQSKEVLCIEPNPYAAECFELSRLKLSREVQGKISFKTSSSEEAIPAIAGQDVIIVDPPRKGLETKVLNAICDADKASQLIYLSCGPASFQRDCEKLIAKGWKIERAEGFLFFPGCDHVEILCSFIRS